MTATQRRLAAPPVQSMSEPALIGVREWAAGVGVGRDTAYSLVAEGRVRHLRVGRKVLIPRSEIEGFAEREATAPRSS